MSIKDCLFHGNACPASEELESLDNQIILRLKAEAQRDALLKIVLETKNILTGLGHDTRWMVENIDRNAL